ncbi:MAG: protein kinase [Acutalibacteraceae bacterium]|nr:protein kinase [Acutalibacteraceae bacterium]
MKRCLNCRKTYEDNKTECPHCGYKPRSKTRVSRKSDTQEIEIPAQQSSRPPKTKQNIRSNSSHAGSFYLRSGEKIQERYSVINVMGYGAFGVAYQCFDTNTHTNVVVKEYIPSYLANRDPNGRDVMPISDESEAKLAVGMDAFIDENKRLSQNDIKCVPPMIDFFKQNSTAYVVTELIQGETLASVLKRKGKLSYHATITIITGVLQGLRKLNKLGIIHGDICPDNIVVTNDSDVYLLDYNLSEFNKNVYTQRESGKLRSGYSALELYYLNMDQGPWTDVYAAAATMYKMLTGVTVPSAIKRNTNDTVTSISQLGVPITPGAEKAMLRALRVDYEKRTQNPEDFLNGLMGDGFDNVSVSKSSEAVKPKPSRKQQSFIDYEEPKEKRRKSSGNFLNTVLVFLIISIIGVVLWLFISGVFVLPGTHSDSSNNSGSAVTSTVSRDKQSDKDKDKDTDTATESKRHLPFFDDDFYSKDTDESEKSEKSTDSTSSSLLPDFLDSIVSRILSTDDEKETDSDIDVVTSSQPNEEYYYSTEEEYYEEDDNYFVEPIEEHSDTNNDANNENNQTDNDQGEDVLQNIIEEVASTVTSALDDVINDAGDYLGNFF